MRSAVRSPRSIADRRDSVIPPRLARAAIVMSGRFRQKGRGRGARRTASRSDLLGISSAPLASRACEACSVRAPVASLARATSRWKSASGRITMASPEGVLVRTMVMPIFLAVDRAARADVGHHDPTGAIVKITRQSPIRR
ncbi:hypothetical protein ASF18_06175 [Methylobacterium sp. Leaf89]|nr:hypothetical protein ASF18_06175 [Methylobacterium sp. Leaf89]